MAKIRPKKHFDNQAGFTLLEVMTAVAVLMVIVMPLLNMFEKASGQEIKTQAETAALQAAQNLLESYKAAGLDWLLQQEAQGLLPGAAAPGTFSNGQRHYTCSLQLTRLADNAAQSQTADLQQQYLLTAAVYYTAAQGEQEASLSTLVQRRWHYQQPAGQPPLAVSREEEK